METPDTEQVELNKTQTDVHKSVSRQSLCLPKTAKLVLEPLKDVKIDVWCRKNIQLLSICIPYGKLNELKWY